MILLVTPSDRASECAAALRAATDDEVIVADTLARATNLLRAEGCRVAVLDQHLLEAEPHEAELMLGHMGASIPVHINLAVSGVERVVREVRAGMQRREQEEAGARQAAIGRLQSELNGTVTALLLSVELALDTPGMLPAAAQKLQIVHELVKKFRSQLESSFLAEEASHAATS